MTFRPRPAAADAARIAQGVAALPLTTAPAPAPAVPPPASRRAPPVVQINFKATEEFANLLATEAAKQGGLRRFLAGLMAQAGYAVPDADINPPVSRRRGLGAAA